jgi:hypothetical protein
MKTVWKYELDRKGRQAIDMPIGGRVLAVQEMMYEDGIFMWVMVDSLEPKFETRIFHTFDTGTDLWGKNVNYLTYSLHYIGTVQVRAGGYVHHIFEEK